MTDLTSRITAALDEQQRLAEAATPGPWLSSDPMLSDVVSSPLAGHLADCSAGTGYRKGSIQDAEFIAANDPSSVLRRVAAQRRTLERHQPVKVFRGVACVHCQSLCHSGSGLGCEDVDGEWPCPEILDLADALGVGVDVTGVEAP